MQVASVSGRSKRLKSDPNAAQTSRSRVCPEILAGCALFLASDRKSGDVTPPKSHAKAGETLGTSFALRNTSEE